jgi:hypothetical protein
VSQEAQTIKKQSVSMIKDSIFLGLLGSINVSQNFPCEGRVHEARFSCWLIANICPGECKHGLDGGGSHTSGSKAQKSPKAESKIILLPPPPHRWDPVYELVNLSSF